MATTCYVQLTNANLGSNGPPVYFNMDVLYSLVDTATNTAVPVARGGLTGGLTVQVDAPVTSQASVLPQCTSAIQAEESSHPGMTFIWMGL
jgi:hypothetical protein